MKLQAYAQVAFYFQSLRKLVANQLVSVLDKHDILDQV